MALNPITTGDAIANYIVSQTPPPGTEVTSAMLKTMWEGIMTIIYNDLKTNAQVQPGTFASIPGITGGPIVGVGGPLV